MHRRARNKRDTTTRVVTRILHAIHDGQTSRALWQACRGKFPSLSLRARSRPVPLSLDYAISV